MVFFDNFHLILQYLSLLFFFLLLFSLHFSFQALFVSARIRQSNTWSKYLCDGHLSDLVISSQWFLFDRRFRLLLLFGRVLGSRPKVSCDYFSEYLRFLVLEELGVWKIWVHDLLLRLFSLLVAWNKFPLDEFYHFWFTSWAFGHYPCLYIFQNIFSDKGVTFWQQYVYLLNLLRSKLEGHWLSLNRRNLLLACINLYGVCLFIEFVCT